MKAMFSDGSSRKKEEDLDDVSEESSLTQTLSRRSSRRQSSKKDTKSASKQDRLVQKGKSGAGTQKDRSERSHKSKTKSKLESIRGEIP